VLTYKVYMNTKYTYHMYTYYLDLNRNHSHLGSHGEGDDVAPSEVSLKYHQHGAFEGIISPL
jgi:hypothetical protein